MVRTDIIVNVDNIGTFNAVVQSVSKAVDKEMDIIERLFDKATSTWSTKNKPVWKRVQRLGGNNFKATLSTRSTPFAYIETGTKERWARMDPRFRAKSKPRVIGASPGAFPRPIMRGRSNMKRARPGIKAREWRDEIARRREGPASKRIYRAINIGLRRMTA